jgi:hypothetical protein
MFKFLEMDDDILVKIAILFFTIFFVINIVYLIVLSIINKDTAVPKQHPWLFALETILIGFGCGLIVFLIIYNRGQLNKWSIIDYILLSLRLSVVSLLMQFSGFYTYMFK